MKAYLEGHRAYYNCCGRQENPYANQPKKQDEYRDWDRGWSDAWRADQKVLTGAR